MATFDSISNSFVKILLFGVAKVLFMVSRKINLTIDIESSKQTNEIHEGFQL